MTRFRISDGCTCAAEFDADSPSAFAVAAVDAVIDVRRKTCKRWHHGLDRSWNWWFPALQIHVQAGGRWVFPANRPHKLEGQQRADLEAAPVHCPALPERSLRGPTKSIRDAVPSKMTAALPSDAAILRAAAVSVYGSGLCSVAWADELDGMFQSAVDAAFGGEPNA